VAAQEVSPVQHPQVSPAKPPRKRGKPLFAQKTTGVNVRHSRSCPAYEKGWDEAGVCDCNPTFESWISLKSQLQYAPQRFSNLKAAKTWRQNAVADKNRKKLKPRAPNKAPTFYEGRIERIERMESKKARKKGGGEYKPSSINDHASALERAGLDFDPHPMDEIQRLDAMDYRDELIAEVGASRVRNLIFPISGMYRDASLRGLFGDGVIVNPFADLQLPAVDGTRDDAGDPAQVKALIDALSENPQVLLFHALPAYAGLRAGCVQDLLVENVTREGIHVVSSYDRKTKQSVAPKTKAGTRTPPTCAHLWEYLEPHLESLDRDHGFLLGTVTERCDYGKVIRAANKAWTAAGLEPRTPHQFRISYRTFLDEIPAISETRADRYMGHNSGHVRGRYIKIPPAQLATDAAALDEYLLAHETGNVIPIRKAS
jgi:integrase